jgi:hypothetical protein
MGLQRKPHRRYRRHDCRRTATVCGVAMSGSPYADRSMPGKRSELQGLCKVSQQCDIHSPAHWVQAHAVTPL